MDIFWSFYNTVKNYFYPSTLSEDDFVWVYSDDLECYVSYHDFIDECTHKSRNSNILLLRSNKTNPSEIYASMLNKNLTEIKIKRNEFGNVTITWNGKIYKWIPEKNIIIGSDSDILIHFKNPPIFNNLL